MTHTPEQIAALKREVCDALNIRISYDIDRTHELIDSLAARGLLGVVPEKIEGLAEALLNASISRKTSGHGESDPCIILTWGTPEQAQAILEAARILEQMTNGGGE